MYGIHDWTNMSAWEHQLLSHSALLHRQRQQKGLLLYLQLLQLSLQECEQL